MSWKKSTIGDVLDTIKNGINCEQNKNPVGNKITRIETISKKKFDFQRVGYASLTDSEKERSKLKVGDILFSHINSPIHVGKSALFDGDEDIYHGINLLLMRTNKEVDSYFFNHFLNHLFLSGYWESNCKKSVNQASVNQKDISKVNFSYPKLEVQKKIVSKIDAIFQEIDKAIESCYENISNSEALFQSYLTDIFETNDDGWVEKSIEDLTVKTKNVNPDKSPNLEFTYVDVSSVSNEFFKIISTQKILGIDAPSRARKNIIENDIIFATVRPTLKRIAIVPKELDNQVASTGYVVLRANKENYFKFIYFYLFSTSFMDAMSKLQKGASYPAVSDNDVKQQRLKVPDYSTQFTISNKLEMLMESTTLISRVNQLKINELNTLKKSILTMAFNGELVKE